MLKRYLLERNNWLNQLTSAWDTPEEIIEIKCIDIALSHGNYGYNDAARDFLAVVERIEEILVTTDEWQALPEYEFLYE